MTILVAVYFWSWTNNWKYDWVWTVSLTCDHERSEGIAMGNEEFENYIVLHCLSMCMMILKLYCINIVNWNSFKAVFQAWITQQKNIGESMNKWSNAMSMKQLNIIRLMVCNVTKSCENLMWTIWNINDQQFESSFIQFQALSCNFRNMNKLIEKLWRILGNGIGMTSWQCEHEHGPLLWHSMNIYNLTLQQGRKI